MLPLGRVDGSHTEYGALFAPRPTARVGTNTRCGRVGRTHGDRRVDASRARLAAGKTVAGRKDVADRALARVRPGRDSRQSGQRVQYGRTVRRTGPASRCRTRAAACALFVVAVRVVVVGMRVVVSRQRVVACVPVRGTGWERRRERPRRRIGDQMRKRRSRRVGLEASNTAIENILNLGASYTALGVCRWAMCRSQVIGRETGARVEQRDALAARAEAVTS